MDRSKKKKKRWDLPVRGHSCDQKIVAVSISSKAVCNVSLTNEKAKDYYQMMV
jgi:hypothetical protein